MTTTQNKGGRLASTPDDLLSDHEVNDQVALAQSTIDRIVAEPQAVSAVIEGWLG